MDSSRRQTGRKRSKHRGDGEKAGIADAFITGVREVVIPGTTLVFTDQPVNTNTQSKPGFKILGPGNTAKN